ncbi:uncharacterized protein LOC119308342 isoform X2 [Triticum dicoccoides]|uniref:uncharacterized protein LOC119308342 isoform X2 n=1 Tax=Triticum dicoccoides TaxID=85692 RepID=UPI00188FA24E|nr:uncharacterized protein LOC119308342 isoform X2 [Triticum dicoccoides]
MEKPGSDPIEGIKRLRKKRKKGGSGDPTCLPLVTRCLLEGQHLHISAQVEKSGHIMVPKISEEPSKQIQSHMNAVNQFTQFHKKGQYIAHEDAEQVWWDIGANNRGQNEEGQYLAQKHADKEDQHIRAISNFQNKEGLSQLHHGGNNNEILHEQASYGHQSYTTLMQQMTLMSHLQSDGIAYTEFHFTSPRRHGIRGITYRRSLSQSRNS